MNLLAVLVTGLFAGGVSCAAVQGGLLAGLVMRQRQAAGPPTATTPPPRRSAQRLADDLTPVGGFIAGKLLSHTVLGALLGAAGTAVQLSVGLRTAIQLGAGALVVVFGLAQLGVPGFRRIVIEPPARWSRFVRGRARSTSAFAPTVLGVASVLIPCGVTLSVEALALASGSPLAGAAIMAVFVVGTAPLFAVLGYLARKAAGAWRGRLATVTGAVVLGMGLYTVNGGLELAGSPLAASRVADTLGLGTMSEPPPPPATPPSIAPDGVQTIVVTAVTGAYEPENTRVRSGVPTRLIVRSSDAEGCVRSFVIPSRDVERVLPVNGDTIIDLGTLRPGRLDYSCGMGMYTGRLTIV